MRGNIYLRQVYVVNETVMYDLYLRTYNRQKIMIRNTVQFGKFEQRGVINRKYCRHQIISTYVDFGTKTAAYTAHDRLPIPHIVRRVGSEPEQARRCARELERGGAQGKEGSDKRPAMPLLVGVLRYSLP